MGLREGRNFSPHPPLCHQVAFPLTLTSTATQVHELGRLDLSGVWHVVGNHKVFPFPIGYRRVGGAGVGLARSGT